MATSSREIKRRIKSVKNIGQITKAMELVSAAKMRKAQGLATASRPYSILSSELLNNLAKQVDVNAHPLITRPPQQEGAAANKDLVVLLTSNRGLAGAYNGNVIAQVLKLLKDNPEKNFDFITVGKKGEDAVRRLGKNIIATFPVKDRNVTLMDAKPIAEIAMQDFLNYTYDRVFIVYTDFISTLTQKPHVLRLLPIEAQVASSDNDIVFEPNATEVLNHLVRRVIEFTVYQTLVETSASEHSARMVAMRNANEASNDLIERLVLTANLARQAGITRELAEISAAKLAMEG